jgi:hypothetical protein
MNLEQLQQQDLSELYPLLRTRSGRKITTMEAAAERKPEGLVVTVKVLFPPSSRRRLELLVTEESGELEVRSVDPVDTAAAQRFAELLRERWKQGGAHGEAQPVAPLRLVKDSAGRSGFRVGPEKEAQRDIRTEPATPSARRTALEGTLDRPELWGAGSAGDDSREKGER